MADETRKIAHLVGTTAQGAAGGGRKGLLMHDTDIGTLKMQLDAGGAYAIYARRDAAQTFTGVQTFTDGVKDSTLTAGLPMVAGTGGRLTSQDAATFRSSIGAQASLGYTPVNKAGDSMTGPLSGRQYRFESAIEWDSSSTIIVGKSLYRYIGTADTTINRLDDQSIAFVCNKSANTIGMDQPDDYLGPYINGDIKFSIKPGNGAIVWRDGDNYYAVEAETKSFAEIYTADASSAQSIPTGTGWTKITKFTANGVAYNAAADYANNKIILTRQGKYAISMNASTYLGTANVTMDSTIFAGGSRVPKLSASRLITTANGRSSTCISGILDVTSVPLEIDLRVRHDNGGSVNVTPVDINLNVKQIG